MRVPGAARRVAGRRIGNSPATCRDRYPIIPISGTLLGTRQLSDFGSFEQ